MNLLKDPWIPVRDVRGRYRSVGIREALMSAPDIAGIAPAPPPAEVALLRLLLAVLHRALNGPQNVDEVVRIYRAGRFPPDPIEAYLQRWEDRFDLFHPRHPFYQVPDLPTEAPLPWTHLLPELASGNNPTLFDHTMDDDPPPASPAEAVVALLVHQSFTPMGFIRRLGVTSGPAGPLAAAAVFIPQGETLFETLLLNLCPPYRSEGDRPVWEWDFCRTADLEGGKAQAMLSGRTRIYTWMSRAVRLLPDDDGRIRRIAYGPGVRPLPGPDLDPMCAYSKTDGDLRPHRLSPERSFWRDFEALLPNRSGRSAPPVLNHAREFLRATQRPSVLFPLVVAGQITDQAKVLDVRRETYPLSAHTLDPDVAGRILDAVACAEETYGVLNKAARELARRLLSPPEDIRRFMRSLPLHSVYWSDLERQFPRFLEMLARDDPDAALRDWEERVYRSARTAWSVTANAVGTTPRHRAALARAELFLRVKSGGTGT